MLSRISKMGVAVAAISALAAGTALASPIEMTISSGSSSYASLVNSSDFLWNSTGNIIQPYATVLGSGALDINGWVITTAKGTSNSPNLTGSNGQFGLDLSGLAASCSAATCGSLTISISDVGFSTVMGSAGGLFSSISNNQGGSGTLTQTAYYDLTNSYFGQGNMIGSVSLSGSGHAGVMGGNVITAANTPYSLTLTDMFTGSNGASFSVDDQVTATPEPGALVMFAAGLLGCAVFINRRRRASRQS